MTTTQDAPTGTNPAGAIDAAARAVDTAVERAGLLDPAAQRVALDLKAAVEAFHREGLLTIVRTLKDDPRGKELLFGLVDDPGVYALLVMHGIVRADPATLAQRALEDVRPYLASHGGGVELVGVELPVVRVRLSGACTGCSQSASTLREVVERAVVAAVPGVQQVEVVPAEPAAALVPLGDVRLRPGAAPATGWVAGPAVASLRDPGVTLWRPATRPEPEPAVALLRIGEEVRAFQDACAHAGLSLERALVDPEGCVLTCPWHGMKYQALTGECVSMVDRRLEAYPARVEDGVVWVRLPG
jgi:Fe-S cluster biogenesis protein NfuA/nitrite reductase/ring-hydroxylating ferredoxin subunit